MANVTAQDVKELRDMTGCGMMDCKRALVEADGNRDEAVKILREMGLAKSAKKAGRIAAEGVVKAKTKGNTGVIVEINCETDFCAKSDKFLEFVETIADTILDNNVADVDALAGCTVSGAGLCGRPGRTSSLLCLCGRRHTHISVSKAFTEADGKADENL